MKLIKSKIRLPSGSLEYVLLGQDSLPVIFLNGFRMPLSSWVQVALPIAQKHQVLLYNRFGVEGSDKASLPQNGKQVVDDLQALCLALGLRTPMVLVGHSLGGLFAQLLVRSSPQQVAGLVLVDSPHPLEIAAQKNFAPPKWLMWLNRTIQVFERRSDPFRYSEDDTIQETVKFLEHPEFPPLPLAVVSGTQKMPFIPEQAFLLHQDHQLKLLELSPQCRHYRAEKSGHFPQITEPEVVQRAIFEIIAEIQLALANAKKLGYAHEPRPQKSP